MENSIMSWSGAFYGFHSALEVSEHCNVSPVNLVKLPQQGSRRQANVTSYESPGTPPVSSGFSGIISGINLSMLRSSTIFGLSIMELQEIKAT
jgi:hypothetical protein